MGGLLRLYENRVTWSQSGNYKKRKRRSAKVFTCFQVTLFSYNRKRPTKYAIFHRPLLTLLIFPQKSLPANPSFYLRNKDLKKDNFPAANSYKTENVWPQGETKRPSYSMSSRTRYTQKENDGLA